jgi:glycosyltransferase involved in cell wall biosynthesis
MKFASIIITHWTSDDARSDTMVRSISSLIKVIKYPYELIVVDNGGSSADSEFLNDLTEKGYITTYVKNARNMHFGYARSQGISLAQGDYIAIIDNDILHKKDWISKCVEILEDNPDKKWYGTPLDYPVEADYNGNIRYRTATFDFEDIPCSLNMRAGSNAFVIRRSDLMQIGGFAVHRIAGTKWTDRAVKLGYLAMVLPKGYVEDMGLRSGYNLNEAKPVYIKFNTGDAVYFNRDELPQETLTMRDQIKLI